MSNNLRKNRRETLVAAVLILALVAFAARLIQLQLFQHDVWLAMAKKQSEIHRTKKAERGEILDRNGKCLATTLPITYAVGFRPRPDLDLDAIAKRISTCLDRPRREVREKLDATRFVQLDRGVDEATKERLESLKLSCLKFDQEPRRSYPMSSSCASVIGFTDVDGNGLSGIELFMDGVLSGKKYHEDWRVNATHEQMARMSEAPVESLGADVTLTIDLKVQSIVEEVLASELRNLRYERVCVIVMDPRNGDILALVTSPSFDPNQPSDVPEERLKCWAITDVYEPGSTMKILPMTLALETHRVARQAKINCEHGSYTIYGKTIRDSEAHGLLTMDDVLAHSSNIGAAKIAQRFTPAEIYDKLRAYGFGNRTCVEFDGERTGAVPLPEAWSGLTQITLAYGHGMSCTPLQLVTAYACIANGGILMKPRLILAVDYPWGTCEEFKPQTVRPVMSPDVADELRDMLENVVDYGTGRSVHVDGIRIAGKTGTAKKVIAGGRGYYRDRYIASFIGFFPADDPRYAMLVVVDDPRGEQYYGAQVAGPVFKRIVEEMMASACPGLPAVPSLPLRELASYPGSTMSDIPLEPTAPQAGSRSRPFPAVTTVDLPVEPPDSSLVMVPDLGGVPLRDAMQGLLLRNLRVHIEGNGRVAEQNPPAGTWVRVGTVCRLFGNADGRKVWPRPRSG